MNKLFEIAIKKFSKRNNVFLLSEGRPSGGLENWLQWELIEALEDEGFRTDLKGKVAKGCDIIVDNEIGVELRAASDGNLNYLEKATKDHPNANLYLFTFWNRKGANTQEIFEKYLSNEGFLFLSAPLTPSMILLVAERSRI